VTLGFSPRQAVSVRLDETETGERADLDGATVRLDVPAHGLRSILITV
jgi:hypothetical protein